MLGKSQFRGASILIGLALCTTASAEPPATDDQRSAEELRAQNRFSATGLAKYELWSGPGFQVLSNQRNGPGEVEIHAKVNDVFIIEEGKATMILGGRVDGGKETAPGEIRGGTIIGGHTRKLAPGDVLWIPAGEPHQIIPQKGRIFRYEVIKVEARDQASPDVPRP